MTMEQPPPKSTNQNESSSKRKRRKKRKSQKKKKNQNNQQSNHKSQTLAQSKSKPQQIQRQRQTVHLPHAKLTLRNIQNSDKLGSLEGMVELLRDLIRDRNANGAKVLVGVDGTSGSEEVESAMIAKVVSPVDIVLDEGSIVRILERDRAQKEQQLNKKKQEEAQGVDVDVPVAEEQSEAQEEEKGNDNDVIVNNADEGGPGTGNDVNGQKEKGNTLESAAQEQEPTSVAVGVGIDSKQKADTCSPPATELKEKPVEVNTNTISARVLYMIPPRKTRRRGELPGHCYLALVPPMPLFIEEKAKLIAEEQEQEDAEKEAAAKKLQLVQEKEAEMLKLKLEQEKEAEMLLKESEEGAGAEKVTVEELKTEENESSPETDVAVAVETETPVSVDKGEDDAMETEKPVSADKGDSHAPVQTVVNAKRATTITTADRSRALAQCRLLLSETVASLSNQCNKAGDSKTDQHNYKGIQIQESPSQKIWKTEEKGSRKFGMAAKYDCTIEQNDDFKKFNESRKRAAEDLVSRPKPPPGGGQLTDGTGTSTDEKAGYGEGGELMSPIVKELLEKKAAARRAKKKATADKKKVSKPKPRADNKGRMSAKAEGEKKKKRSKKKSKKKSGGDGSKNAAKAPPRVLLKKA